MKVIFLNCQRGANPEYRDNLYIFFKNIIRDSSIEVILLIEVSSPIINFFTTHFSHDFQIHYEADTEHLTLTRKHIKLVRPVEYHSFNKFLLYDKQRPKGMTLLHLTYVNYDILVTLSIAFGHWPAGPQPKARSKSAMLHSNILLEQFITHNSDLALMIADTNLYALRENEVINNKLKRLGFVDISPSKATYDLHRIERTSLANACLSVLNKKIPGFRNIVMPNQVLDRAYLFQREKTSHRMTVQSTLDPAMSDHAVLIAQIKMN